MKKIVLLLVLCACLQTSAGAQLLIIKYITSKIIRAIDLKVQQLQNDAINLTVLQKNLENRFSQNNLAEIASWEQKQKDLYAGYFDELTKVKNAIAFTSRVSSVVQKQKQLVTETKKAMQMVYTDTHFSPTEAKQFVADFENLLGRSATNLSYLLQTITSGQLSMNDAERFERLVSVTDRVDEQETSLRSLMQRLRDLALTRERNATEIQNIKRIYGFK